MNKSEKIDFQQLPADEKGKVLFARAIAHHKKGDLQAALNFYARSLAFYPEQPDAYNNMAVALRKLQHYEAALACYQKSLDLREDFAGTYSNMGNVLNDLDRLDEALAAHKKAVELDPDEVQYLYNKGLALRDAGYCEDALQIFDAVLEKDPSYKDCPWDRALTYLVAGDFEKGFAEYDARWQLDKSPPRQFSQPRWQGDSLQGKRLFIHREQGFGDSIQFVRLISSIKKRYGGTVILECQPELMTLFQDCEGIDHLVPFGSVLPEFDTWIPLMSLGHLLDVREDNIPGEVPYLFPPKASRFRIRPAVEGGMNIAIAWAGSPTHQNDRRRSVPLNYFIPLAGLPDVRLFSLQKGEGRHDLQKTGASALIVDAGNDINDFADSAGLIDQMDLVITIDTSVAHLAGALGKEVWVMLPYTPDWRWMLAREDSPWYPQMTLIRQPEPGNWQAVFDRVTEKLRERLP
ncbi:MAG: glycosyltransferase family protein [Methylocystaceae bacterium]|nr:glycosyltransferase family protein [Methylocystaceae bacterium]